MSQKGLGQYDIEYCNCPCFWGIQPGKYVKLFTKYLKKGHVLDLGAGEGKNAIYLARHGFKVTAVECSEYAINNFNRRLSRLDSDLRNRIEIIHADIRAYVPPHEYDAIISYGLLHCLSNLDDVFKIIKLMQEYTVNEGYNVIAVLTNRMHSPKIQEYLEILEITLAGLKDSYQGWKIISLEDSVLEEKHLTSNVVHKHSIIRLLAQKE